MSRYVCLCSLILIALWASPLMALTPSQVLVVANSNSPDSLEIANYYIKEREIPPENLVVVSTSTQYEITSADLDTQIVQPLALLLRQRRGDDIRCICLTYGIPVRINNKLGAENDLYKASVTKAHYRLAINHQLVALVGKSMPASIPSQLLPASKFFAESNLAPHEPLLSVDALRKDIQSLMTEKLSSLPLMADSRVRAIAMRQLMALSLDNGGLKGLIEFIESNKPDGAPEVQQIKAQLTQAQQELAKLIRPDTSSQAAEQRCKLTERIEGLFGLCELGQPAPGSGDPDNHNAVDSELTLVLWSDLERSGLRSSVEPGKPMAGSSPNPMHWQQPSGILQRMPKVLMTSRLDGPGKADVLRMIKDGQATEKEGLKGTFYIDAGVTTVGGNKSPAYAAYDTKHLKRLASFLAANSTMKVVLDENEAVFKAGSCPDAALYVGWYSLENYIPAFTWNRGAVGFHIASFEAMQLRNASSKQWCPQMIRSGIAATLGPVFEPYLETAPPAESFFPLLMTGKYTIAKCYWRTIPHLTWRQMLIADPLYNPFKNNPQMPLKALPLRLAP